MTDADPYSKLRPPEPTPADEICHCSPRPVKLMYALTYNPVHCLDCNLEVAPEALGLDEELACAIAYWRSIYGAIYALWLDSGDYEEWAAEHLIDIGSPVNVLGREVQRKLNRVRRCYYWLHQGKAWDDVARLRNCPSCGTAFSKYGAGIFGQLICETCSIVTDAKP
jgi:hypothetical protein